MLFDVSIKDNCMTRNGSFFSACGEEEKEDGELQKVIFIRSESFFVFLLDKSHINYNRKINSIKFANVIVCALTGMASKRHLVPAFSPKLFSKTAQISVKRRNLESFFPFIHPYYVLWKTCPFP